MREILFRGKDIKGNWHIGLLAHLGNAWYISNKAGVSTAYEVIPSTIGQSTGLTDKNGNKIFEGDIVQIKDFSHGCALNYKQPTSKWAVKWYEDTAKFSIDYMKVLNFNFTKSEVIGNIHDNPEQFGIAERLKGGQPC